jgi:hypothetical protein
MPLRFPIADLMQIRLGCEWRRLLVAHLRTGGRRRRASHRAAVRPVRLVQVVRLDPAPERHCHWIFWYGLAMVPVPCWSP